MSEEHHADEAQSLQQVISALQPLSPEDRRRVLLAVATFFQIESIASPSPPRGAQTIQSRPTSFPFSSEESMSPKDFLIEKQPSTDVERIAVH